MPEDEFERELTHFEELRTELAGRATSVAPDHQAGRHLCHLEAQALRESDASCCCLSLTACTSAMAGSTIAWRELTGVMKSRPWLRSRPGASPKVRCWHPSPSPADRDLIAKRGAGGICLRSTLRRRAMHLSPDRSNEMDHWNTENVDWQDDSLAGCPLRKAGN
jgi:hypothetical protein